jgi:hypothetical protein
MNAPRKSFVAAGVVLLGLGAAAPFALAADAPGASEPGVWQKHEHSFHFMGFTSTYSCDGLADQLRRLLVTAGARADLRSDPGACANAFGRPDRFANARLVFYTLAPANAAGGGDPAAGTWRSVTIGDHRPVELQVGDCELVEQFRDEVLKKLFTIRNLNDNTRCIPHQESGSTIDLRFEVLSGAPGATSVATAAAPPRVFIYPKAGQSKEQEAKDRGECETTAATQSGYDPAHPVADPGKRAAYTAALGACLEPRGYTVR